MLKKSKVLGENAKVKDRAKKENQLMKERKN